MGTTLIDAAPIARWADRSNRRNIMAGGVALWSVWEILVIIKCSIARHARLGNQTEGDR